MPFEFVDLFAGVGGFHAALTALGGRAVLAAELDEPAAAVYKKNWLHDARGDVRDLAKDPASGVPPHAVLAGGFPCQPFSKSGHQRGMDELRGQLFGEVLRILDVSRPPVVMLENVRNIAGPRQRKTWETIVWGLRETGYRTPSEPCVYSPHLLARNLGGSPQTRDRVYILGTYVGRERAMEETDFAPVVARRATSGWDPKNWSLERDVLEPDHAIQNKGDYSLSDDELEWIRVWNDFLARTAGVHLPGFPLWSDYWTSGSKVDASAPAWKQQFEAKNIDFYMANRRAIDAWKIQNPLLVTFPASRRKLEWQAGAAPRDLRLCLIHLRPSGIRVKQPDYAPALVAMNQTPIYGPRLRRITLRESARLQGFPDWFDLGGQTKTDAYKQLGNAVHPGVVYHVLRQHVLRDAEALSTSETGRALVAAVIASSEMCIVPNPNAGNRAGEIDRPVPVVLGER